MAARRSNTAAALVGALALALITGCSSNSPAEPAPSATAVETTVPAAPVAAESAEATPAPAETTEAPVEPAAPEVDEFSQVVDGVVYQGTEKAPVRIGEDTPGQAPAVEPEITVENWDTRTQEADKYLAYVAPIDGGYYYKIFGLSRHGSFRELDNKDYGNRTLPTLEEVLAAPMLVDGRVLDRSEYVLWVV
ncbi:hypothetical protein Sked_28740 [Sanguibacter keddieii DSM 10542]|uniref:Uncharacterized protein n=1 Tax=Sanguibacter keddieii (strain ATCC 51767 / DSM 10542 / NCFB 3025 / ST-74) TaxID=446469 RepID=D1BBK5_SANKS|nr:hypothetical protein [Sanguibacter keddieii]ACZ22776.1 hypothetical protein Sked_28740 [Sanguibacter keddieii DSM 10542]